MDTAKNKWKEQHRHDRQSQKRRLNFSSPLRGSIGKQILIGLYLLIPLVLSKLAAIASLFICTLILGWNNTGKGVFSPSHGLRAKHGKDYSANYDPVVFWSFFIAGLVFTIVMYKLCIRLFKMQDKKIAIFITAVAVIEITLLQIFNETDKALYAFTISALISAWGIYLLNKGK